MLHLKSTRFFYSTLCLFFCLSLSVHAQDLSKLANKKMTHLKKLIKKAEKKGIYTEKEQMTLRTAEIYLEYANWDEKNVDWNTKSFELIKRYKDSAQSIAQDLPNFERREVNTILQNAIDELKKVLKGKYVRKNGQEVDWSIAKVEGNKITQNGKPVFLLDHFWKPATNYLRFYGMCDGAYISPNQITDDSGKIAPYLTKKLKEKPDGNLGFIFVDSDHMPKWAMEKYDNFDKGAGVFGKYDIDHPGAKELYDMLYSNTVPYMKGKNYTKLGYMMYNEPSFFTEKGKWNAREVSKYTHQKFKNWLSKKHKNIDKLNKLWNTNYKDFQSVEISIPISGKLQGTPIWHDWMTFNNYRVTQWFSYLNSTIKKYDPAAPTHVKIMPWLWTEGKRDHGMDIESVLRVTDIMGSDAMARESHIRNKKEHWMKRYSFLWEEISMMYDFFRSVQPNKIIFDTETHFASAVNHRNLKLKAEYIRACYWLAAIHGLNASNNWIWGRKPNNAPDKRLGVDYPGTNSQQPAILNSMHATLIDLNTYSEEITSFQFQEKPLRIFYSLTNAIHSKKYMSNIFKAYESLYFEGTPLGFATEKIIENENIDQWDVIVVHKTNVVTENERTQLQQFLNQGGTIITDKFSLKKNEYGIPLQQLTPAKGKIIIANTLSEIKKNALQILDSKQHLPELNILEKNTNNYKTCIWRCVKNKKGNFVLTAINLGKTTTNISLEHKNKNISLKATNLLTGTASKNTRTLKPFEILFIEVTPK